MMAIVDDLVCFSLYAASRATTRAYSALLAPWQLSYPQYLVLVALWVEGEKTVNELGEILQLDSGTLSPLLRRLEDKQLIERRRSTADQRVVIVAPTQAAARLQDELAHVPATIAQNMGLASVEEGRELVASLRRLTDGMNAVHAGVAAASESVAQSTSKHLGGSHE